MSLPDFKLLIRRTILSQLENLDNLSTVWVRGDNLPLKYLKALAVEMTGEDFQVIAVYDPPSGRYRVTYSEAGGGEEGGGGEQEGDLIPDPEVNPNLKNQATPT